ncbi:MAG: ATP-binding cassette domain-containing protein [Okeania sp. SIO3H1]|uniref:ABC transporter ATP-binding protein n=1 Tax=Okeania sp. SIO1I7 TaxID=2607772 RepID=UPI0013C6E15F|nr:ATP-binding cassette domain-containing protein [Okeania sp. SIO1I7]NEN88431.1 ATP-binding cassette domain-containing protein [Okeania sp. SIO3H1]NET26630.1 ATP-binding cassette domain-containing protein [Okeania sp. SIO1I7]
MGQQQGQLCLDRVSLTAPVSSQYLLKDISLAVEKGARVAIVGTSGAGKTSLLRLLNRLNSPTSGSIYLDNQDYSKIPVTQLRQQVTMVLQESKLLGMSAAEAIAYPLKLRGIRPPEIQQRCKYWIEQLHIPENWLSRSELQLSVGQKQLVAIARGAVIQPKILLLDEPTSPLDVGTADRVIEVLKTLTESGVTVIMVNHQIDLAQQFCTQLLHLEQGELIEDSPSSKVDWVNLRHSIIQLKRQEAEEWS